MLALAYYTGWSRAELLALDVEEFLIWISHLPRSK